MESADWIVVLDLTIPSDLQAGCEAQKRILAAVDACGFDEEKRFAIRLALEEALINAIKHGNRLDPAKQVRVQARITPRQAEIVIEDQGPGFRRDEVPDPTCPENLERCCGRGILLMESYMDQVKWSNCGRRVKMIKKK